MTAPVSLAEIKAKGLDFGSFFGDAGYVRLTHEERDALVELAEAYIAVRDLDKRPKGMGFGGFEAAQAHERLALAAKQVRP